MKGKKHNKGKGGITLDGPPMEAYSSTTSMNNHMSGDFRCLRPIGTP